MNSRVQSDRVRFLVLVALWLPLFAALYPLVANEPLTSAGEDRVLIAGVLILVAFLLGARWWGRGVVLSLPPAAVWTFLFVIAARTLAPERILELGWLSVIWFFICTSVMVFLFPPSRQSLQWRVFTLTAIALAGGVVFLLVSDLILVVFQTSAIPIAVPRFWMERVGYLWPLLFGVISALLLSGRQIGGKTVLAGFVVVLVFLGFREWQWRRKIENAYTQTEQALGTEQSDLIRNRLNRLRAWNERKQLVGLQSKLRFLLAEWRLEQGRPMGVYFQVSHGIEEAPEKTEQFLSLLSPEVLNPLSALPLNRLHNLQMTVDLEPSALPGRFFLLDRWGRIWLHSGSRIEEAFEGRGSAPTTGADPADLEIVSEGGGAVIMTKRGEFFFRGVVPEEIRQLLESRRAPAQTYVDFELSPNGRSACLLSDRGPIIQWGEKSLNISPEQQVEWPYSIARDLELSPDGRTLYLMDGLGKVHVLGEEGSIPTGGKEQPYWPEERAADIEMLPSGDGFYLMANYGGIYFVGDSRLRKKYRVPDPLQAIEDWAYAVAFQIVEEGNRLVILTANGGLRYVQLQEEAPEQWLVEIDQLMEQKRYLEAVGLVDRLAAYAPELVGKAVEKFDADFCRIFSRMTPDPDLAYWVAADAEQVEPGASTLIVDRWGRLWMEEQGDYTLFKDLTLFNLETGPATDVEWIEGASAALILYDDGMVEPWGAVPEEYLNLFKSDPPEKEGWVDLEPLPEGRGWVAAGAFGGFHVWGEAPQAFPAREDFRWGDIPIGKDIEFGPVSNTLYFLDGYGVIHPFGEAPIFTKPSTAPYWRDDIARSLIPQADEKNFLIMNRYGECPTIRSSTGVLSSGVSRIRAASDFVDLESTADGKVLTFLERNFKVTHRFSGSQGVEYYARQLEQGKKMDFSVQLLENFHFGLEAAETDDDVKTIAAALSPEWLSEINCELRSAGLSKKQLKEWRNYFKNYGPLFVDLEMTGGGATVLDLAGRLHRFNPSPETGRYSLDILDAGPLAWITQSRPVDMEPSGSGFLVLFEDGRVFSKGPVDTAAEVLAASVEIDPVENSLDLEISPDGRGCLVMDREGRLHSYGEIQIEDYRLEQVGWEDYEIARDLEFTSDGEGLFLLDGVGSIHRIGRTGQSAPEEKFGPPPWFGEDIATALTAPDGDSALVLDRFGRIHLWGQSEFPVPTGQAFLPWSARGEKLLDVERTQGGEIGILTSWGRVDYFRPEASGVQWHRKCFSTVVSPLDRIRELHKAVAADPAQAERILGSVEPEKLVHLAQEFQKLPEDFFHLFEEYPELVSSLVLFPDVQPAGFPGDRWIYLLDRWGRVLQMEPDSPDKIRIINKETLAQPSRYRAVALAVYRADENGEPAFLITDNRGHIKASGQFPSALLEGMPDSQNENLEDVVDLVLSHDGQAVYLLDSDGEIVFFGRSAISPEGLPGEIWPQGTAVALVRAGRAGGFYLLDALGAVHSIGNVEGQEITGHWFGSPKAAGLCPDPEGQGLYLASKKGWIYSLGSASPIPENFQPKNFMKPGEQVLRLTADPENGRLLGWTTLNRLLGIPVGRTGAHRFFQEAEDVLDATPVAAYHRFLDALEMAPVEERLSRIEKFSPRLVKALVQLPEWKCGQIHFWKSFSMKEPKGDEIFLLNRWGEIYQGSAESPDRIRVKGCTRPEVEAVDFLPIQGPETGMLVLYQDGRVEQWNSAVSEELKEEIENYNQNPVQYPVDLAWSPDRKGFYILSDRGPVRSVGQTQADLSGARFWQWGDSMAQSLEISPGGETLYLFDRLGAVHVSGPEQVDLSKNTAPYFSEPGMATALAMGPRGDALYFLDAFGGVHLIGNQEKKPDKSDLPYFNIPAMVNLLVTESDEVYILSCNGRLYKTTLISESSE